MLLVPVGDPGICLQVVPLQCVEDLLRHLECPMPVARLDQQEEQVQLHQG